jgi:transketolase
MLGTAAGLALGGKIPFVSTFSCFVIGRFEVIKVSIAYSNANVTIVGTHSGVGTGPDGYSQMAQEDLAMMRSLPNMVCIQPADDVETAAATEYLAEHVGPAFLRLTRQPVPRVHPEGTGFTFGKGEILKEGRDVTVVASGATVGHALEAAVHLESTGVSVMVVNMSTVKPIDEELLVHCAKQTGRIMTVEDHSVTGGLGSAVCETLSENRPVPVRRVGASGSDEENYRIHGLDARGIGRSVMEFVSGKSSKSTP